MANEEFRRVVGALTSLGVPAVQAGELARPMAGIGAFLDWFVSIPESGAYIQVYTCLCPDIVDVTLEVRTYADVNPGEYPPPDALEPTHIWFPRGDES